MFHLIRRPAAAAVLALLVGVWGSGAAKAGEPDGGLQQKLDDLSRQVQTLKERVSEIGVKAPEEEAKKPAWFSVGGDLRVRHDILRGKVPTYTQFLGGFTGGAPNTATVPAKSVKNGSLLTNRLGLDLHVFPVESVTLNARMVAYKTFGMADQGATQAGFFGDRQNAVFDGTIGHVPASNTLALDRAYATVKEIFDQPIFFSAGRRPSTGGVPGNLRDDRDVSGNSGTPSLLVDYAFDGFSLGASPDVKALPGFSAKLCYGRAYDGGYQQQGVAPNDMDMLGVNALIYETNEDRVEAQYQRGFNIVDAIPGAGVKTNLGDIEEWGGDYVHSWRDVGPGDLTAFLSGGVSLALPNDHRFNAGFGPNNPGLLCSGPTCSPQSGYAYYLGARYDLKKTRTKIGAEFNRGSKYWFTFAPAGDDVWTSKLGTRGNVYELYAIQELGRAPIARDGKVLFRLGWQYYDFQYTGSNSWIGAPQVIKDLTLADMQFMAPIRSAYDIYTTFEVRF